MLVRRHQWHPSDPHPLFNARPIDGERRSAFLDAKTRLGECPLEAILGTRICFAARCAPEDYLLILAPPLRTDHRAHHRSSAVAPPARRDQNSAATQASHELRDGGIEIGIRNELQNVAGEDK